MFNLSTAVLINSINISIKTLEDRILGWGLNRYERAFDYYMFNTIVLPPFYHEIFTLNYNDGSSNLTKSITEFGIISFIFIPLIFFFFFTDKVNKYEKIFFLTIIFTQVLRGAGYFNGGFAFFSNIYNFDIFKKKMKTKKKILITGSAGFIGFSLAKSFLESGYEVIGIDNINNYYSVKLKNDRLSILKKFKKFQFTKN